MSALRARQFREDNGPLAHPVRPESFVEINNFYTATVYEKGAELVRMLRELVGAEGYAGALDLYFDRHDGEAVTIEDWLAAFEDATGRDLSQFALWYSQAGTPRVTVEEGWIPADGETGDGEDGTAPALSRGPDELSGSASRIEAPGQARGGDAHSARERPNAGGTYTLTLTQCTPPTPGQPEKRPLLIPVAVGLLYPDGSEAASTRMLELTETRQSFEFDGLRARPVPSLLRGFSAPVIVERETGAAERALLLANDPDLFNRWEAGRQLGKEVLARMVRHAPPDAAYLGALAAAATDGSLSPAFRARILALPGEDDMAQTLHDAGTVPDPDAIHAAREALANALARRLADDLPALRAACDVPGPYRPDAEDAGRRALGQAALALLTRLDGGEAARAAFREARNMTEEVGALSALLASGHGEAEADAFYGRWRHDRLVVDKWFALQIAAAAPSRAVATAARLTEHPDFEMRNPNRFRAVLGALAMHPAGFHDPSGAGYRFLADWLLRLDPVNPQTTARLSGAFETWRRYDADRQALADRAAGPHSQGPEPQPPYPRDGRAPARLSAGGRAEIRPAARASARVASPPPLGAYISRNRHRLGRVTAP